MKLADLLAKMEKLDSSSKQSKNGPDDRYWKPTQDESGNGYARIRFLPNKNEDELPFAKTYSHGFKNEEGRWFIDECPTTIGVECPICKENSKLWNSGAESDKEVARDRKRKLKYVSNILVVEDPKNKENEGKVFLYAYGQKIFAKIMDKMRPAFEDEEAINPFDTDSGADLKLKIRKVAGYTNYDKSEFAGCTSVDVDTNDLYDLGEFTDKSRFKSFEELAAKFNKFVGLANDTPVSKSAKVESDFSDDDDEDTPIVRKPTAVIAEKTAVVAKKPVVSKKVEDDDDDLDYFKKLAADLD